MEVMRAEDVGEGVRAVYRRAASGECARSVVSPVGEDAVRSKESVGARDVL